jgi:hypothetical protein
MEDYICLSSSGAWVQLHLFVFLVSIAAFLSMYIEKGLALSIRLNGLFIPSFYYMQLSIYMLPVKEVLLKCD